MAAKQSRGVTGRNSRRDQSLLIALGRGRGSGKFWRVTWFSRETEGISEGISVAAKRL